MGKLFKVSEKISERINRNRQEKIDTILNKSKEIDLKCNTICEIKEYLLNAKDTTEAINELIKDDKYKETVKEMKLETLILTNIQKK